jgi:hypothetical protein
MSGAGRAGRGPGRATRFSTSDFTGGAANLSGGTLHAGRQDLSGTNSSMFRQQGAAPPAGGAAPPSRSQFKCNWCNDEKQTEGAMCQNCQVRAARVSPPRKRTRSVSSQPRPAPAASDSEEDDSECSEDEAEDAPAGGHCAAYAGAFLAYPDGHALAGSAPQEFGRGLRFCCAGAAGAVPVSVVWRYEYRDQLRRV